METPIFREEFARNQPLRGADVVLIRKVAPTMAWLAALVLMMVAGFSILASQTHVYRQRFIGFVAPPQSLFGPANEFDAYIIVPRDSTRFVFPGQLLQIRLAGDLYEDLLPLRGKVNEVMASEEFLASESVRRAATQQTAIVVASIPSRTFSMKGEKQDLRPGMMLQAELQTESLTWLELMLKPLRTMADQLR